MDLVSLTNYCSHALVTTNTKVIVNHQDFDHDHHHHHLDRLDAWRLLNKLSIAALWHQKFPLAAAAAAHNVLPSQTFVIFHCKYHHYHQYHRNYHYNIFLSPVSSLSPISSYHQKYHHYHRNHCNCHHIHRTHLHCMIDYRNQQ